MPSEADHLALAAHNHETIDFLFGGGGCFTDWVVTVAFYTALHLVDALLDHDGGRHGVDHTTRERVLKTTHRYSHIYKQYNALREASTVARYLSDQGGARSFKTFAEYCKPEDVKTEYVDHRLNELEKSIRKLLKQPAKK